LIQKVKRSAMLDDDTEYQLVNAKRSRGGIVARDTLPGRDIRVKTQFYARARDFLISRRQIIHGACGLVPDELDGAVVSNEYDTMVMHTADLLPEYLEAFSHTPYFQRCCFHSSIGVDVEKMVFKLPQFLKLPMPVPPLAEQKKITDILSAADRLINSIQRVVHQLQRMKAGLLEASLTTGVDATKAQPAGAARAWPIQPLRSLIRRGRPICYGILKPGRGVPNGVPVVKVKNIFGQRIDESDLLLTDPEIDAAYQRSKLVSGDILLTIRGTTGRLAMVPESLTGANITQDTARIAIDPQQANARFVFYVLQSRTLQHHIDLHTIGQAVKGINIAEVRKLPIPMPSLEEQSRLASIWDSAEEALQATLTKISAVQRTKAGLLQDLLTGKVRVTV